MEATLTRELAAPARRTKLDGPKWTFVSFVHLFVDYDDIVGGEQVRPYELFHALADLGFDVHVFERHNPDARERATGRLTVRPLPLPRRGLLRKLLFWPVLYAVFLRELSAARAAGRRVCLYQTLPWGAADWRRLEQVPAFLLFWIAKHLGATTWGALHDLPYDHYEYGRTLDEQSRRTAAEGDLARRAAALQLRQVRQADFISVVSENMRRVILERTHVDPSRVRVFRSAVNPEQVGPISDWQPPKHRPWRIGFLGHAADAQLPLLVQAIRLLECDVMIDLVLAGEGAPDVDAPFTVTSYGGVYYRDFADFAEEMDLWVIPYGDLAYLQLAWQLKPPMNVASGRPVVMTETSETEHSGLAPYLYLAGTTPASIAEQIEAVIRDPDAARRRAEAGRDYLLHEGTWRGEAERLVSAINHLHGGPAS